MGIVNIDLNVDDLLRMGALPEGLIAATKKAAAQLAAATHAKAVELASTKLHTRRQQFIDALSFKQVNEDTWLINLDRKARWIEEGMKPHEMIDDLLKSPKAKQAADGSKYLVVPFKHNKGPTQSTVAQQDLTSTVKSFLRNHNKKNPDNKIGYGTIERNPDGSPKLGLLHKFDIKSGYNKTHNGPGQGWGPIGQVKMGATGIPFLQGIRIYQREVTNKQGKKSVERNIMTFRVVSSKHRGTGRWKHPGLEPAHIFDEAADWAMAEWPKIKESLMNELVRP